MSMVPPGRVATTLVELVCPGGHPLSVYGADSSIFWTGILGPRCVKCGREFVSVRKVADLDHSPWHRYLVRRGIAGHDGTAVFEVEVAADRFEITDGVTTFYVGEHRITSSRQLVGEPVLVD